jgi:hypothetical protein
MKNSVDQFYEDGVAELTQSLAAFKDCITKRDEMKDRLEASRRFLKSPLDASEADITRAASAVAALPHRITASDAKARELLRELKRELNAQDRDFGGLVLTTSVIKLIRIAIHNVKFFNDDYEACARAICPMAHLFPEVSAQAKIWPMDEWAISGTDERGIQILIKQFLAHIAKIRPWLIPIESCRDKEKDIIASSAKSAGRTGRS